MKYEVFEHDINVDGENVKTYGIVFSSDNVEVVKVCDVSTDFESLSMFVDDMNEKHLDPFKLGEEIEKYMSKN